MPFITMNVEITEEFLRDCLEIGCGGGIDYWATRIQTLREKAADDFHAVVITAEHEPEKAKTITLEDVRAAIEKILTDATVKVSDQHTGTISNAVGGNDASYLDAGDCDVIIQIAMFGEIVYG